jgi:hypothetical protein
VNLNGNLLEDLVDDSVQVACLPDRSEALNAMFSAIPSASTKSADLVQQMLTFNCDHTIFDKELRPLIFGHDRPSHSPPSATVPVVQGALKHKGEGSIIFPLKLM